MELIIKTKAYGTHTVYYDDEDHDLVSRFKWCIAKGKKGVYYARTRVKNKYREELGCDSIRMHRLIMNAKDGQEVDHIDHDGRNNRRYNLRFANDSQSTANTRVHIDSKTGFKGVTYKAGKKLYLCRIRVNSELLYGGMFKCPLDAAKKYNELAKKYFGEFACLNNITPEMEKYYASIKPPIRRAGSVNKSGYIGVSITKYNEKRPFVATLSINGKNKYLGNYETAIEAAKVYNEAVIKYGKPLHYLNKIPE